jgi:hypothetical protein
MNIAIDFPNCTFSFTSKPPANVLVALKAQGFRWQSGAKNWIRYKGWAGLPNGFADWVHEQCTGRKGPMDLDKVRDHFAVAEDYECSDMGYEDACARACGL